MQRIDQPMHSPSFEELLSRVKNRCPLVHHITNAVTMNDCANVTLCIGAAPVMAEALEEVGEMVANADALVLNIGTLSAQQVAAMLDAGRKANECKIPVILDPVGAGATQMRTKAALLLLEQIDIAVLKGNEGEIGTLAGAGGRVRGVDSQGSCGDALAIAQTLAQNAGIVVAVSGPTDIVTDGKRTILVDNGHEMLGRLSGTGCMAASLAGAFAAVSSDHVISSAAALATFGIAGELAAARSTGPYSFRTALMDELAALLPENLTRHARARSV